MCICSRELKRTPSNHNSIYSIWAVATHLLDEIVKYMTPIEYPTPYQAALYRLVSPHIRHLDLVVLSDYHAITIFRFDNLVSLSLRGIEVNNRCLITVGIICRNLKYKETFSKYLSF